MKNLMSKTASGYGRFKRCKFAYNPVAGDLKSGIPADVEIPAPVRMTTFLATRQLSHHLCVGKLTLSRGNEVGESLHG